MTYTEKVKDVIQMLASTDIKGCISGSSMIPDADFDVWTDVPDVDVFVYSEPQLAYAINQLQFAYGFEPKTKGEQWKIDRINQRGGWNKTALSTVKLEKCGVTVNLTWKKGKIDLLSVLSSFDMSIIMIGLDIPTGVVLDLRTGNGIVKDDPKHIWSDDPFKAVPNPLREQDVDMYGTEQWVRQFARAIKYWNRGFDTRPMARFYIGLIDGVIETGRLFESENSEARFSEFVSTFQPVRDKMAKWLEERDDD